MASNGAAAGWAGQQQSRIVLGFHKSPAEIEPVWREIERDGVATLFQSYDWMTAWCETAMAAMGEEPLIVTGTDGCGRVVFVWPMAIRRTMGTRVLTWLGSPFASYNMGLWHRDAAPLAPAEVEVLLRTIARERPGIAAIEFNNQPAAWEGVSNPFATLYAQPSGECTRDIVLEAPFETFYKAKLSASRRDQLRRKERKLGELGKVEVVLATAPADRKTYVDAFLAHKSVQLEKIRAPNIFADQAIAAFLYRIAGTATSSYTADLVLLKTGGVLAAMRWGFRWKDRYYSFNEVLVEGPALRSSPGTLLNRDSMSRECAAGTRFYDFGPGPGAHKDMWSPVDVPLADTRMVVRAAGWLPVAPAAIRAYAKGQVRAHPAVLRFWRDARFHMRGLIGQLKRSPPGERGSSSQQR